MFQISARLDSKCKSSSKIRKASKNSISASLFVGNPTNFPNFKKLLWMRENPVSKTHMNATTGGATQKLNLPLNTMNSWTKVSIFVG